MKKSNLFAVLVMSIILSLVTSTVFAEDALFIDQSGNVGIGTSSPASKIDVRGNLSTGSIARFQQQDATTGSEGVYIVGGSDTTGYGLRIDSLSNSGRLYVGNNGNVGIGTTNPGNNLEIYSNSIGINAGLTLNKGATGSGTPYINLYNQRNNGKGYWIMSTSDDNIAQGAGNLAFYDSTASSTRMVINGNGNVGVGTTSPDSLLDLESDHATEIRMTATTGTDRTYRIITDESHRLDFYDNTAGAYRMSISTDGNVGIGTNDPGSYRLFVNGTAYATGAAGALSDGRHKMNIDAISVNALDVVNNLRPVSFEWKEPVDSGMEGKQLGFIAQEVERVLPEVVLTQDNEEHTKGLKYSALIPMLTKAIQELAAENRGLKTENNNLHKDIEKIKTVLGL